MPTILLQYVKLNYIIKQHGHQTDQFACTTKAKRIWQYVNELSQLDYTKAVKVIKKDNAFLASKNI
jgi:hypothetical protein